MVVDVLANEFARMLMYQTNTLVSRQQYARKCLLEKTCCVINYCQNLLHFNCIALNCSSKQSTGKHPANTRAMLIDVTPYETT